MERYRYSDAEFRLIENSCLSFAIYQFIDHRVVTIALSQGFLDLFGYTDRKEAYNLMDNDMYHITHPEDIARVEDEAVRFAREGGEYNVLYRVLVKGEYRLIRSRGKHTYTDTGVRLAVISYADEGRYIEGSEKSPDKTLSAEMQRGFQELRGSYDPLTGLPGLNHFFELADAGRGKLLEKGEQPVILYFDFNGMKQFNLRYGFAEGDRLIIAMSKVLIRHFSDNNCCRIGGDRFAVYTNNKDLEERLNTLLSECRTMNNGKNLPVRVGIYLGTAEEIGIGIACDRAKMAADGDRKKSYSGFSYFREEMLQETEHRQYLLDNLDKAIREGWIQAYHQPIIRSANGRVCDEEALARWIDPVRGFLSPGDFIPVLEQAGLIYKLDLSIVEQILQKMKTMEEEGLYIVPSSINISRSDFEACDIVEEIRKQADAAGVRHELLTIEITESTVAKDLAYIKKQVDRFHRLGFRVWMDDYGSGYSSPEILQEIPFDAIKLDMQFIRQYEKNKASGVIISSLVKMAASLGIETVVEGVETAEQAEFLKEIGCTRLQGYYYSKPVPLTEILRRYREGEGIGFENPAESEYYSAIGKVNLYDLSLSVKEEADLTDYFNTMPMAIVELGEKELLITRANQSYRQYINNHFNVPPVNVTTDVNELKRSPAASLLRKLIQCAKDGKQLLTTEKLRDGKISNILIRRIAANPVNGKTALLVIILGITEEKRSEDALTYANVAHALSADYVDIFHVNLETEDYILYYPDARNEDIAVETRGKNFFAKARKDAGTLLYEDDRMGFISAFTKENVVKSIDDHGAFTATYRLYVNGRPEYVQMKAIYIGNHKDRIIIGVNNVNAQMKQRETMERIKEEKLIFSRMTALSGEFISFYSVDPATGHYYIFNSTQDFESLGVSLSGTDFFGDSAKEVPSVLHPDDLAMFQKHFSKEAVMKQVMQGQVYSISYRLMIFGEPRYVCLRAALVNEEGRDRLIFGVSDVDEQVKREQEYAHNLSVARNRANIDVLTGVKNQNAFADMTEELNRLIKDHAAPPFSVVALSLKLKDEAAGEEKDELIRLGCRRICQIFRHSPVFRMSELGFAVLSRDADHENMQDLIEILYESNHASPGAEVLTVLSCMSQFHDDKSVEAVYKRAKEALSQSELS